MDCDMFIKPAKRPVSAKVVRKFSDFRSDEQGGVAIFVIFIFFMMLMFGGIAVDVMRFEMRRVTLQETMDRAMLAAANVVLPPSQTPKSVAESWFAAAGVEDQLTVDYTTPVIDGASTSNSRTVTGTARVRSYNHFMGLMNIDWLEGPTVSAAQQGISKIEVMLVLDITGSMAESSGSTTKIAALRQAASNFVTILKYAKDAGGAYTVDKDPNDLISVGLVPYSSQVNIPVALRNQFTVSNLSSWDYVDNQGVPKINCLEIQPETYNSVGLSRDTPIPMAAVANTASGAPGNLNLVLPGSGTTSGSNGGVITLGPTNPTAPAPINTNSGTYVCNQGDNPGTAADESASNLLQLPTTDIDPLKTQITNLNPRGTTSIAVGMRWGTALMDESARPIYEALRGGEAAMAGRPANNNDGETRKIIVLMTDGTHVSSNHIRDPYKSGPSPIWRGDDGRLAIRYTAGGPARTGGLRPGITATTNTCSGWVLAANREYFIPHLKASSVRRKANAAETEGNGTGTQVAGGCDPRAWQSSPTWTGSGTVRQLDWSEVWRFARVDWVVEQLYLRSNVVGATNYWDVYNMFVGSYLTSTANMDSLLNTNCTAAKTAGIEVFGIVLGDNVTEGPVQNCSSPGTGYYYKVTNADDLNSAFEQIAVLISPLRLTQ